MNFVIFFKQKTAYEMRISDWSSDVCSSDLTDIHDWTAAVCRHHGQGGAHPQERPCLVHRDNLVPAFEAFFGGSARVDDTSGVGKDRKRAELLAGLVHQNAPARLARDIMPDGASLSEIGRASCRERVCQYV